MLLNSTYFTVLYNFVSIKDSHFLYTEGIYMPSCGDNYIVTFTICVLLFKLFLKYESLTFLYVNEQSYNFTFKRISVIHKVEQRKKMNLSNFEALFIALNGLSLLWSVFSNICVPTIVIFNKKMKTPTNILICNLAVSDLLFGGIVLPQNLHDISHTGDYHEGM